MNVSYATMEAMGMLVKRLGQDARRLEKALAETMNASAEWKRIAEEMKKERNAEREALGIQAAKEAGKVLGMVEGEGLRAAAQRVVKERAALRAECDDLRRVFALVHISLGIRQGEHIGNAIDALKKERDELATRLRQSIGPRSHPVKVGEYLRRLTGFNTTPAGEIAQVIRVHIGAESNSYEYEILRPNGQPGAWVSKNCTPCDPPASHDTPAGKEAAHAAAEPKPGDVVRLVRVPTCNDYGHAWILEWGAVGNMGKVCKIRSYPFGNVAVVDIDARLSYEWPLSCVEVVRGGDK